MEFTKHFHGESIEIQLLKFTYLACALARVSPGQDMLAPRFSPLCASWTKDTAYQPLNETKNIKTLISVQFILG